MRFITLFLLPLLVFTVTSQSYHAADGVELDSLELDNFVGLETVDLDNSFEVDTMAGSSGTANTKLNVEIIPRINVHELNDDIYEYGQELLSMAVKANAKMVKIEASWDFLEPNGNWITCGESCKASGGSSGSHANGDSLLGFLCSS
jgi:hypothetical protein